MPAAGLHVMSTAAPAWLAVPALIVPNVIVIVLPDCVIVDRVAAAGAPKVTSPPKYSLRPRFSEPSGSCALLFEFQIASVSNDGLPPSVIRTVTFVVLPS